MMRFMPGWNRSSSGGVATTIDKLLRDIAAASGATGVGNTIVHLLEPLEFEIHPGASRAGASDLRYVLTVHHRGAKAMWKHHRSFDEYETFEKQIVDVLHHGHFCSGGCPWLESFLASAFPQTSSMLRSNQSATVIERRRKTVLHVLQTLQKFLVNRLNHACSHVIYGVAHVFLEFIYGDVIDSSHVLDQFIDAATALSPTDASARGSMSGTTSARSKKSRRRAQSASAVPAVAPAATEVVEGEDAVSQVMRRSFVNADEPERCTLCGETMPMKDIYVLRLRCGHRFHDECAMPQLNAELKCPTCHVQLAGIP